jgi:hypothetical protein
MSFSAGWYDSKLWATAPRRISGKALLFFGNPVREAYQAESLALADLPGTRILLVTVSVALNGYSDIRTRSYTSVG